MVSQPIDVITCSAPQPFSTQETGTVAPELAPLMPYSGSIKFQTGYVVCYYCCQNADNVLKYLEGLLHQQTWYIVCFLLLLMKRSTKLKMAAACTDALHVIANSV